MSENGCCCCLPSRIDSVAAALGAPSIFLRTRQSLRPGGYFDAVSPQLLGEVERLVGLHQQRRQIERPSRLNTMPMESVAFTGWPLMSAASLWNVLCIRFAAAFASSRPVS